ncbi:MAG: serine/threonine-protein kinase [Planctomycetota bacterium]|nr:serine/threonine-protein kinase [Planctomycetota bacterium]
MNPNLDTIDLTNKSIAGYSILHRLGVGGMSEVYLAFQESLHRHVALKVMRADLVGSSDHEQRFLQEARAVASLIHPNIVQVYDVGKFESIHYIAQEYVPGSNLFSYVQRRGALPLAESLSILWQTSAALQKAASIGLVHRDIKPDNLLLTPDGEVKVADFGLARARGQSLNLTAVGVTLGSPLYMSPEQIQGLAVDSRSDLYSLGATAYHMLTGRPPFSGETALALAMQHLQAEPTRLEQLRFDLPLGLIEIVHRLLAKNPDDRFASAVELSRALKEVMDSSTSEQTNQVIPFSGLVVEQQRISNLEATQELQKLAKPSAVFINETLTSKSKWVMHRFVLAASALILGFLSAYYFFREDLFANQVKTTAGVTHQSTIQRQYALALIENNLKHWLAVSENFPPTDNASKDYAAKAKLQIARLAIEGGNFTSAVDTLISVLDSECTEPAIPVIATIELGYVSNKLIGNRMWPKLYEDAASKLALLEEDKQKLVTDSLPRQVKEEWGREDNRRQNEARTSD